jgi:hypothetical protein
MDKGIRPACNAKFLELLPQRATLGNTEFRRAVMNSIREDFGITEASAATHYNHSFKTVKASNPELVEGLGRPEDKKGGRKKKEVQASEVTPAVVDELDPMPEEQLLFTVKKKSDGSVVAENLSLEDARELCNKAKQAKKAALYWV